MEKKDDYILAHSERVKTLALRTARASGLDDRETEREIACASLLHDIGLLAVPDEVLQAKEDAGAVPREVLQGHPVEGESLLENVEGFQTIRRIVRAHHERFDGSGYPDGLRGEEIPLASCIIGLVEAYDAMLHDPASGPRDPDYARREVREGRGAQFDPDLADVFLDKVADHGA